MGTYDSFLFLEEPDSAEDLGVHVLCVVEVLKCSGKLVLVFLVKDYLKHPCAVVYFEDNSHWLCDSVDYSTNNNNLNFEDEIGSGRLPG